MELYCITATFRDGTQRRQYAISRFAASQRHAEFENLEGVECVTTEPFNVPTKSYPAMTAFLNELEEARASSMGWLAEDSPPQGALSHQEGGSHYKDLPIQPVEYIHANGLSYFEGNVVKYVTRWRKKNGLADLKKARHYIDLLIELEAQKE